jgi:alpha,alpha-trehalase
MSDEPAPAQQAPHPVPLRQYSLLADGERGALVGPRGDIAFLCAPRWHDPAVFSDLLGGRGLYVVRPADERFVWGGSYESGTLIWRNRWVAGPEILESREALAFPPHKDRVVLLRRLEARRGTSRARVRLDCRGSFGSDRMQLDPAGETVWTGRTGKLHLRWSGIPKAAAVQRADDDSLWFDIDLDEGDQCDLVLEIDTGSLRDEPPDARELWRRTEQTWADAVPKGRESISPRDVEHSWAVLRGLTSPDGAMVAAATTSLPERSEAGRDYDYRYAWVRDQCFVGEAIAAAGGGRLLETAVTFVRDRLLADGSKLVPAYTIDGDPVPEQQELDLPGYPGAPDVHLGNQVREQFQLDAFGESLLLFAAADRLDVLDADGWKAVDLAVQGIVERGDEKDAGIWELEPRRWAHSRLTCAAGLRAVASQRPSRAASWLKLADSIVDSVNRDCLHPSGRWQRAPDDPSVDAALLLPAIRGAIPAQDPRSIATWRAVIDELTDDGYVYRFRHQPGPLDEAEGAFLLCGFHMAIATHQQGDSYGAVRWFERNRSAVGPPGLFTEEFDVVQRQLRGNLPQAFVHALLIESSHVLATDNPTDNPTGSRTGNPSGNPSGNSSGNPIDN